MATPKPLRPAALALVPLLCTAWALAADAPSGREALPPYHSPQPMREPRLFEPAFISTPDAESHPAFTPDARTLFFQKATPDQRFGAIVYSIYDLAWGTPRMAPFSGRFDDREPCVSANGSIYFASNRPTEDVGTPRTERHQIWRVDRKADGWSTPVRLGDAVNEAGNARSPDAAAAGTLYFSSDRPGGRGGFDLYRCRRSGDGYGPAESLGDSINTAADETDPWLAADGTMLCFASNREGGLGGYDLYAARAGGGGWTRPRNLGDLVNSPGDDRSPRITPDGEYFFWSGGRSMWDPVRENPWDYPTLLARLRNTRNTLGDLYQIDLTALESRP